MFNVDADRCLYWKRQRVFYECESKLFSII